MKVIPGEFLSTEEELASSQGSFTENGNVYAAVAGIRTDDSVTRTVKVQPIYPVKLISKGDEVLAVVQDIYDQIALIQFTPATTKPRLAFGNSFGYLRISELANGYVEHFRDLVKIGDVLKARIVEVKEMGIYITIKDPDLGVIKAFCSNCRFELQIQKDALFINCPKCKNRERRKTPGAQLREDYENKRNNAFQRREYKPGFSRNEHRFERREGSRRNDFKKHYKRSEF